MVANLIHSQIYKAGYILLSKKMLLNNLLTIDKNHELTDTEAMLLIIGMVNFKDKECSTSAKTIICHRGESIISKRKWAEMLHWNLWKTNCFFLQLQKKGYIEILNDWKSQHIRIVDYELFTGHGQAQEEADKQTKLMISFEEFWNYYHEKTELPKTERGGALKEWKRMKAADRKSAFENIEKYYMSLTNINYCKKAINYLKSQSYNNEFWGY